MVAESKINGESAGQLAVANPSKVTVHAEGKSAVDVTVTAVGGQLVFKVDVTLDPDKPNQPSPLKSMLFSIKGLDLKETSTLKIEGVSQWEVLADVAGDERKDDNVKGNGNNDTYDVFVKFDPYVTSSKTFTLYDGSASGQPLSLSLVGGQNFGFRLAGREDKIFGKASSAPNNPPKAEDDTGTVVEEGTVTLDVLANDTDLDGPSKTITRVNADPAQGTAIIVDGKIVFTAAKDFNGEATITYTVSDGTLNDEGQAVVTVSPVNDAPTAGSISVSGQQGEDVRGNVTGFDVDRDTLTYKLADDGAPKNGTVTVKGDGTFAYKGDKDFLGTDTFKVLIEDGKGGQTTSLITVTVKPAPDGSGQNGGNGNSAKYDDLIEAGDGDDWIHGGLGDDEMQGEGGNDTIYGGQDNGKIGLTSSGAVNEVRIGDNLYGNDGRDVYHYGNGDGVDMIWDFRAGEDIIKISGFEAGDVKVVYLGALSNRIGTGDHAKLALILGDGKGAIVFNDLPRPDFDAVMLQFATGTKRELTWSELLSKASLTAVDALSSTNPAGTETGATPDPVSADAPIEISGVRGNDLLTGGGGADRLYGNEGYNWLEGLGGNDQLFGGNDRDVLIGGDGKDRLYGNEGDNWLEANAGMDELYGGNAKDVMLGGGENDVGYGNGGDDWIVGGSGSDKLYGAGGADIIFGDDYIDGLISGGAPGRPEKPQVDPEQPSPWVISEGRFLFTKTSMTMADDVQKVTATGRASIAITGNSLDNIIIGNTGKNTVKAGAGDDAVDGGYGNDSLSGGAGDDRFIFSSKLGSDKTDRKVNFDKIADFSAKDDTIELDNKIFKKLGKAGDLKSSFFTVGTEAKDANDYLIYNKATGVLSYDADGSGSKAAVEFAQLKKGLVLKYSDFDVI